MFGGVKSFEKKEKRVGRVEGELRGKVKLRKKWEKEKGKIEGVDWCMGNMGRE